MSRYLTSGTTRTAFLAELDPATRAQYAHTPAHTLRDLVLAGKVACPKGWTVTKGIAAVVPQDAEPAKRARTAVRVPMAERKASDIAYVGANPTVVQTWTNAFEMALKLSAVRVGTGRRGISLLAFSRVLFLDAATGRTATHGEHLRLRGLTPREAASALVEMFQG